MKRLIAIIALSLTLLLNFSMVASAKQTANEPTGYSIDDNFRPINFPFGLKNTSKEGDNKQFTPEDRTIVILNIISGALIRFAAPIAIVVIALSGLQIIVGSSESDKIDTAKKTLTWAILGLFTIILSYSLVRIVLNFLVEI